MDDDRLVIDHSGWKIAGDLVFRDGSGGRYMERGEFREFWHIKTVAIVGDLGTK